MKGRPIPLLPTWAVRPVQSLSACTRLHFTLPQCLHKGALYPTSVPAQGCTLPYLSACARVHFTFTLLFYKKVKKEKCQTYLETRRYVSYKLALRTKLSLPPPPLKPHLRNPICFSCHVTNNATCGV